MLGLEYKHLWPQRKIGMQKWLSVLKVKYQLRLLWGVATLQALLID